MWGMTGEVRFDGRSVDGSVAPAREGEKSYWHSQDGTTAFAVWGQQLAMPGSVGWSVSEEVEAGIVVLADCTLYSGKQLIAELGLDLGNTRSTSRLLIRAYQQWGKEMLARLDGDFSFVLVDLKRRTVFAAVDPTGMRSLFFRYRPGESFAFSTNAEALADWVRLDARLPESRLLEALLCMEELAYVRPEIPGVSRLLGGHACHIDRRELRLRRYWAPGGRQPELAKDDVAGWVEGLRWRMREAVRKRVADGARVGVMFSGGLDSSAVLAFACDMLPAAEVTAYSVLDRSNPSCPETRAIDRMIAATGATSVQIDVADMGEYAVAALDIAASMPRFIHGRVGFLSLFYGMAARSGVQVMMNGLDADALFDYGDFIERELRAGRYKQLVRESRKLDHLIGIPWFMNEVRGARVPGLLPWPVSSAIRAFRSRTGAPARLRSAMVTSGAIDRFDLVAAVREQHQLLYGQKPASAALPASRMESPIVLDGVGRCHARSRHLGIELRCPFMDRELMEFAAWIPLSMRLRKGRLKWILRQAMNPILPHGVTWRGDKFHPGSYFDRIMLQPVLDKMIRDFHGGGPAVAPYIDRTKFLHEAERWQAGKIEAVWVLKGILLLEHWLQHNHGKVRWGS
jgi:asparagine synthase (glutamine-hydrolysing)